MTNFAPFLVLFTHILYSRHRTPIGVLPYPSFLGKRGELFTLVKGVWRASSTFCFFMVVNIVIFLNRFSILLFMFGHMSFRTPALLQRQKQEIPWRDVFFHGDLITSCSSDRAVSSPEMAQLRDNLRSLYTLFTYHGTHDHSRLMGDITSAVGQVNEANLVQRVNGVDNFGNIYLVHSFSVDPLATYYLHSPLTEFWGDVDSVVADYVAMNHFALIVPQTRLASGVSSLCGPVGVVIDGRPNNVLERYEAAIAFTQFFGEIVRSRK